VLDPTSRAQALARRFNNVLTALGSLDDRKETLTPATAALLAQVQDAVEATRQAFEERWNNLAAVDPAVRDRLRTNLCDQVLRVLAEVAQTLLPALDGTTSQGIPVELDPILTRLAHRADPTNPAVILSSAPGFQYSVQRVAAPIQMATSVTGKTVSTTAGLSTFLFLRLPKIERDSALLHVILAGHELGHVRDWATQTSQNLVPPPLVLSTGAARAEDIVTHKNLISFWAREIVADIFAAFIFGPASLLSFTELVLTVGTLSGDSFTHPGPNRRIEIILGVLRQLDYFDNQEARALLSDLEKATAGAAATPVVVQQFSGQEIPQAAWDWLSSQVPSLIAQCQSALAPDEILDAGKWQEIEAAASQLSRGRPFGELVTGSGDASGDISVIPVPEPIILNAGWLVRMRGYEGLAKIVDLDPRDTKQSADLAAILDGLLLKSLEISDWRLNNAWGK